jgi:hypothetical protein
MTNESLKDFSDKLCAAGTRPLLTHLNADTSWLLSIPYPPEAERPNTRLRFNLLIDPWFDGPQSDVASWFSTQYHAIPSSIRSIAHLQSILREAESLHIEDTASNHEADTSIRANYIDAVAISHEFTDHCHQRTLLDLPQETPIFSTTKAVQLIRSWRHFTTVIDVPSLNTTLDWRTTSQSPLPPWLGISRLITEGNSLYYHSAIIISIADRSPNAQDNAAEAIIYTPHGVESATFAQLSTANPPISTLAFLHGLHDVSLTLSKQLNLGAHNAFKAQKLLKPKYWVGTHDEVKKGVGLIAPLLRRKAWTLEDAIRKDRRASTAGSSTTAAMGTDEKIPFVDCPNGVSIVLE